MINLDAELMEDNEANNFLPSNILQEMAGAWNTLWRLAHSYIGLPAGWMPRSAPESSLFRTPPKMGTLSFCCTVDCKQFCRRWCEYRLVFLLLAVLGPCWSSAYKHLELHLKTKYIYLIQATNDVNPKTESPYLTDACRGAPCKFILIKRMSPKSETWNFLSNFDLWTA